MTQGIGEVGVIKCVHLDDNKAQIFFVSQCAGITVATKALKKVVKFICTALCALCVCV